MGVRPSIPSCPVLLIPNEGSEAALRSDKGAFEIGDRDVSGTAPCNAPPCGPWFGDTSGGGRAVGGADLATLVTRDADVGGGCGLGGCGIVDAVEDGGATVDAGPADDADDVLGCNGTEEGGAVVDTGGRGDTVDVLGGGDESEEGGASVQAG